MPRMPVTYMVEPALTAWLYNGDWLGASDVRMICFFTWKLLGFRVHPLAARSMAE